MIIRKKIIFVKSVVLKTLKNKIRKNIFFLKIGSFFIKTRVFSGEKVVETK